MSFEVDAFKGKGITKVSLPDGLQSIGASAFEDNNLTGPFLIPKSVKFIGEKAFKNAGHFTTPLILIDGVIGPNAFEGSSFTITI